MLTRLFYVIMSLGITLFCLPKALAQNAVGLTLGGPTFIHFTHGLAGRTAAEVGVSFSYNNATHIYGDYLLETHDALRNPQFSDVGMFYGFGGMLVITNKDRSHKDAYYGDRDGDIGFAVRLPLGLDWRPTKTRDFSFHIQLVPNISIVPETELNIMAGLGLKYHF